MQRNAHLGCAIAFAQRMIEDGMISYKAIKVACQDYNVDSVSLSMGIRKLGSSGVVISESSNFKTQVEPMASDVAKPSDCSSCGAQGSVNLRMRL